MALLGRLVKWDESRVVEGSIPSAKRRFAVMPCAALRLLGCCLWLVGVLSLRAQAPTREFQLKAVFLFNFVQFTEWPTNAFADASSPLVVGILGADPFGKVLDETVHDEKIKGRDLVIKRFSRIEEVTDCHVLYISPSETERGRAVLEKLRGRNILTVGESENFVANGGIIRFVTDKNKIRFLVNAEAARRESLTISSKLLRLAENSPK